LTEDGTAALRLSYEAGAARRALGPAAWAVLEHLALDARAGTENRLAVETSIRKLASAMGLSKGTVSRALTRLLGHGIVTGVEQAHDAAGRFSATRYLLTLPVGVTLHHLAPRSHRPSPRRTSEPTLTASKPSQPSLFDTSNRSDPTWSSHPPDPAAMSIDALAPGVRMRVNRPVDGGH
jgi:DNA-binding transcriptional ArsR family regulator